MAHGIRKRSQNKWRDGLIAGIRVPSSHHTHNNHGGRSADIRESQRVELVPSYVASSLTWATTNCHMGDSNSGNYSINVGPNSGIHIQYLALHQKICYPDNANTELPNIGVATQVSTELPPSDPLPVPTTLGLLLLL